MDLINTEPLELLRLQPGELIASESAVLHIPYRCRLPCRLPFPDKKEIVVNLETSVIHFLCLLSKCLCLRILLWQNVSKIEYKKGNFNVRADIFSRKKGCSKSECKHSLSTFRVNQGLIEVNQTLQQGVKYQSRLTNVNQQC